jgi:asparagine synthase (glutamine-hydrolysing)
VVTISKLNSVQLENIKQILTLRYSTNLESLSLKMMPKQFKIKQIANPENFVEESIKKSICVQLGNDPEKIGISLSSGIDSTLVLAILRKEYPNSAIESVSVKFSDSVDETENSRKISEKFETNHHVLEIDNFLKELPKAISIVKQPFWDLHWYYLVKEFKKYTNLFLSGDGGDELFGGYTFRYKKFLELTTPTSTTEEKITAYLKCHERDWVPDQQDIFSKNMKFSWDEIHSILKPYFNNSLPRLSQVFLADYNGKLTHNMQPLYSSLHQYFDVKNITPILNDDLIHFSCQLSNNQKFDNDTYSGKIILQNIIDKLNLKHLISPKKQGFSVNTTNMWYSYGQKIFEHYFDKSCLIEDKIINTDWIKKYISKNDLSASYVNKFLGLLALEIWYKLFITQEMKSTEILEK